MKYIGQDPAVLDNFATAVANGAISSGDPCIIESAGTVAAVASSGTGIPTVGTSTQFDTGYQYQDSTFDSSQNVTIVVYADTGNSYYGTAVALSTSGSTITAGTPVVYNSASSIGNSVAYDANAQKSGLFYWENAGTKYGYARVITASGTTLSLGTEVAYTSVEARTGSAAYDENAQKIVVVYSFATDYDQKARVATISGTSMTFGTELEFHQGTVYNNTSSTVYLPTAQKILTVFEENGASIKAYVLTVSGTSLSAGSAATVTPDADSTGVGLAVDSNDNIFLLTVDTDDANERAIAFGGSVSGTTVTFGDAVEVTSNTAAMCVALYDPDSEVFVFGYSDLDDTDGYLGTATVSGNTPTIVAQDTWVTTNRPIYQTITYDTSADKSILSHQISGVAGAKAIAVTTNPLSQNLTAENFIGFADKDYADGADAVIQAKGAVNDKQASLTAGQSYFVQTDGTIGTTADDPSVFAGTAVSATQLIVKG